MIFKTSLMYYRGTQHMFQSPHIHEHIDSRHLSRDIHWLLASYRLTKNKNMVNGLFIQSQDELKDHDKMKYVL